MCLLGRGLILPLLCPSAVRRSSLLCGEPISLTAKYVTPTAELIWQDWTTIIRAKIWH